LALFREPYGSILYEIRGGGPRINNPKKMSAKRLRTDTTSLVNLINSSNGFTLITQEEAEKFEKELSDDRDAFFTPATIFLDDNKNLHPDGFEIGRIRACGFAVMNESPTAVIQRIKVEGRKRTLIYPKNLTDFQCSTSVKRLTGKGWTKLADGFWERPIIAIIEISKFEWSRSESQADSTPTKNIASASFWYDSTRATLVEDLVTAINAGANVNERDLLQQTPLHFAARQRASICIHILLIKGANANAKDSSGQTPLDVAKKEGCADCILVLQDAIKHTSC